MIKETDDGSSSSEDEITKNALREAADHQFLKETYFSAKKADSLESSTHTDKFSISAKPINTTNLKSLRQNSEQSEKFENFGVSTSFQNYVAKKLDELLNRNIRLKNKVEDNSITNERKKNPTNIPGVRLLNSSTNFLTTKDETTHPMQSKKRKIHTDIEDESKNLQKCTEAAVNPEWVLSKVDSKAWTNKRKEPEFKYKRQKNGTLVEQLN